MKVVEHIRHVGYLPHNHPAKQIWTRTITLLGIRTAANAADYAGQPPAPA